MKTILQKLMGRIMFIQGFKYRGYVDYPGVGRIYDHQVWRLVKDHSRWIDRISSKKMTEMSLLGQCIIMGIFDDIKPEDPGWTFYGRHSLYK